MDQTNRKRTLSSSESSSRRTLFFSRGNRSFSFTLMAKQMGAKDAAKVERKRCCIMSAECVLTHLHQSSHRARVPQYCCTPERGPTAYRRDVSETLMLLVDEFSLTRICLRHVHIKSSH